MSHRSPSLTREVQPADTPRVSEMMAVPAPGSARWSDAMIAQEISSSESFAVRGDGGHIDAFIFLRDVVDAFEISYLATHPQARKKGLMRALLTRAADFANQAGQPLWLEVHDQNEPAKKLYEAAGFRPTGRRPGYYADGGAAILYTLG